MLNLSSFITPSASHLSLIMSRYLRNSLCCRTYSLNPSYFSLATPSIFTSAVTTRSLAFLTTDTKEVPCYRSIITFMLIHAITSSFLPTFIGNLAALCSSFDETRSATSRASKLRMCESWRAWVYRYPSGTSWLSSSPSSSSLAILTSLQKLVLALSMISLNTGTPYFLPCKERPFSSSEESFM